MLTRRSFVAQVGAAVVVAQTSGLVAMAARARPAAATGSPAVMDAMNALLAFVVPGSDAYSVAQGLATPEPGGVDAGVVDTLIETLDLSSPTPPPFPTTSAFVVYLLDLVAGDFVSPGDRFAQLDFGEKVTVFAIMESEPTLAPLAGAIIPLAANLAYSEAGVFDASTRSLTGTPLGWSLTGYEGVADGRDEFVGYYRGRKKAKA